jgi:hypothetical protein
VVAEASLKLATRSKFYTATSMDKPELLGSPASEGSAERLIGAEFLQPEKQVSGADFPEQADEYEERD